jgi:hypothetical protein
VVEEGWEVGTDKIFDFLRLLRWFGLGETVA